MSMTALDILNVYISFFEKRGHKRIENSSLVPKDDPTTLFTSSGMQPIIKYLLGEEHPEGERLVNVQNCFRAQDIDEIGDNRHTTFFRMLGNWSLGDYFKNEEIPWFWEFLVDELKLDPKRLYVSVFEGYKNIPRDEESAAIWKELFKKAGVEPEGRIFYCGVNDNWWSRSGTPDAMPEGEPGGPDTEVYFDFRPNEGKIENLEHEVKSGRLLEIGNSVFMTYQKKNDSFVELPQKNVDFGGGLERLLAAVEEKEDIFQTSLYSTAVKALEALTKTDTNYKKKSRPYRIIIDHLTASTFMVSDGIIPSNKGQGYILRRLIRRAMVQSRELGMSGDEWLSNVGPIIESKNNIDGSLKMDTKDINFIITQEVDKFRKTINQGLQELEKIIVELERKASFLPMRENAAKLAFDLFQSYGLPIDIFIERLTENLGLAYEWGEKEEVSKSFEKLREEFEKLREQHQQKSREGAKKKFNN